MGENEGPEAASEYDAIIAEHDTRHPAVRHEPPLDRPDLPERGAAVLPVQHPGPCCEGANFPTFITSLNNVRVQLIGTM